MKAVWFLAPVVAVAMGCALIQKSEPLEVTYYTPEPQERDTASQPTATGTSLRLGTVTSTADLGQRIASTESGYQVHYYDRRRWTLRPEIYVRRSLTHTLFEKRAFRRTLSGDAPTLDIEVLAFEEVKEPARHEARVTLRLVLATDHVLSEDTLTVSQPVAGESFEAFVEAMGRALDQSADEVAGRVGSALGLARAPNESSATRR